MHNFFWSEQRKKHQSKKGHYGCPGKTVASGVRGSEDRGDNADYRYRRRRVHRCSALFDFLASFFASCMHFRTVSAALFFTARQVALGPFYSGWCGGNKHLAGALWCFLALLLVFFCGLDSLRLGVDKSRSQSQKAFKISIVSYMCRARTIDDANGKRRRAKGRSAVWFGKVQKIQRRDRKHQKKYPRRN